MGRDDDGDRGTGLPASIEFAWGVRERPGKGPKPGLSLERIVEAAVKVADAEGLAAVSMSRVAADLGASTMALYRYVAAKDELLTLMMDAGLEMPPPAAATPEEGWRAGLSRWAWGVRAAYRRHRWALRIPISAPPIAPNNIAWLEQGLRSLAGTGLGEQQKLSVILLLSGFVRNVETLEADMADAAAAAGSTVQEATAGYSRTLARLVDAERFPTVTAAIAGGAMADEEDQDEFVFGLERILDGIDALVRARAGTTASPPR